MFHRSAVAVLVLMMVGCARLPARQHTPPNTPAGHVLAAWLEAFDSGDSAQIDAFEARYASMPNAEAQMRLRQRTGGFELVSIERSDPRRVEFLAKERNSAKVAYGIFDLSSQDPPRIAGLTMQPLGPLAAANRITVDATERAKVIAGAIVQLDDFYVFPDVAHRIDDSLRARLDRGEYDPYTNGVSYAYELGKELRDLGHDKHLRMDYSLDALPLPPPGGRRPPSPARPGRMDATKCGFVSVDTPRGQRRLSQVRCVHGAWPLRQGRIGGHDVPCRDARPDHRPARQRRR